ncbi:MAG: glyoxalase/bleomycin resistance/extradiol dioxygenase family protein, partial [Flavobacteriales bacterium]
LYLHLQWHAGTNADPLIGGSVIKIFVKNIDPIYRELIKRGTIESNKLSLNTPWNTNEFGFYDLNQNAIFFVADL